MKKTDSLLLVSVSCNTHTHRRTSTVQYNVWVKLAQLNSRKSKISSVVTCIESGTVNVGLLTSSVPCFQRALFWAVIFPTQFYYIGPVYGSSHTAKSSTAKDSDCKDLLSSDDQTSCEWSGSCSDTEMLQAGASQNDVAKHLGFRRFHETS